MEWVTNAVPRVTLDTVTPRIITVDGDTIAVETHVEALARVKKFRAELIMGPPKATEQFTVAELQAQGMIGLYRR